MASYTTAATGTAGTYTTAEEELRKKKRQALLDAQAGMASNTRPLLSAATQARNNVDAYGRKLPATPPSTGGGPGGIVGPGGESPDPYQWKPQPPPTPANYNIPADLQASRDAAYQRETVAAQQGIAADYANQERQLKETLARMGYSGPEISAGEGGNRLWNLRGQEATDLSNARSAVLGRQSAENLGWATGERTFQQNKALQQAGLKSAEDIASANRAESGRQFDVNTGLNQQEINLKTTLGLGNLTLAQQQQAIDKALAEGRLTEDQATRLQQNAQFNASQSQQNTQFGQTLAQQGSQFGQTLAEQQATRAQQAAQFTQLEGGWDPVTGMYRQGSNFTNASQLAQEQGARAAALQQQGLSAAAAEAQANREFAATQGATQQGYTQSNMVTAATLANTAEQFKFDLATKNQAAQAVYDYVQQKSQGLVKNDPIYRAFLESLGIDVEGIFGPKKDPSWLDRLLGRG